MSPPGAEPMSLLQVMGLMARRTDMAASASIQGADELATDPSPNKNQ
jgi:hypothetical protein